MAFLKVDNVSIRGISGCVPKQIEYNKDLPFYSTREEACQVIDKIGIECRHVAPKGMTASDLCVSAAEKILEDLGWSRDSVDLIAFATQMPDYRNHPTSFVCHERLGLKEDAICLDFFHGCPAWVVSLSSVASMMQSGAIKRALLLDGDTVSQWQSKLNRESRPLFGDAGTATALEFDENTPPIYFNIGTLSEDGKALAAINGGARNPWTLESLRYSLDVKEGKVPMNEVADKMDSMDVFSFAITKVPKALKKLCSEFNIDTENVDRLVLHQANKLIIENIAKRMKMPMDKVPLGLRYYGNTTSASIPLAIVSECSTEVTTGIQRFLTCGFGTGLAWGAMYFETNKIICPSIIEI